MKVRELSYAIGDLVYDPPEIVSVYADGINFKMTYIEEAEGYYIEHTIVCPINEVEVIVDGA